MSSLHEDCTDVSTVVEVGNSTLLPALAENNQYGSAYAAAYGAADAPEIDGANYSAEPPTTEVSGPAATAIAPAIDDVNVAAEDDAAKPRTPPASRKDTGSAGENPGTAETRIKPLCPEVISADDVVKLTECKGLMPFLDQHDNLFVWAPSSEKNPTGMVLAAKSREFKKLLWDLVRTEWHSRIALGVIKQAIDLLDLKATGVRHTLQPRCTTLNGQVCIDLGADDHRMVVADQHGFEVRTQETPLFIRPRHMRSLPLPIEGGTAWHIFEHVAIREPGEQLLILTWLVAALISSIKKPILAFIGPQGAGKSSTCRRFRSLVDPSQIPLLGEFDIRQLFITLQNHAVACFENVGLFDRATADLFCRAVTGNGIERRRLYTDCDQVIFSFQRAIMLNGIDLPSKRADFLDRCLLVRLQRLDAFQNEATLDENFEKARPQLFGALLSLLVKTLAQMGEPTAASEFRMADFARVGRAVACALGRPAQEFDRAYQDNLKELLQLQLDECPIVNLIRLFVTKYPAESPWVGTMTELLKKLVEPARSGGCASFRDLPKSPEQLSSRLIELQEPLRAEGIILQRLRRTNKARPFKIHGLPVTGCDIDALQQRLEGGNNHGK